MKKLGIGMKITIIMSVMIILALGVVGFLSSQTATASLESNSEISMLNTAKDNAQLIAAELDNYKNDAKLAASRARIQSMDWSQQEPVLLSDAKSFGFMRMGVATPDGNLKYPNGATATITDREYFKAALKGETYLSDPLIAKTTGKLTLYLSTPVYDSDKNIVGVLVCTLDNAFLSDLIKEVKGSASGYAFILNSQGTVIGHKKQEEVTRQSNVFNDMKKDKNLAELAAIVTKMNKGETGHGEYTYNGKTNDVAYARIPSSTWSLGVIASKSEVMAPVTALQNKILITAAFFTLFTILICTLLIRLMVTRPLTKTVGMIQDLSKGKLGTRLKVKSKDEVGRMSEAMNMLADDLQHNVVDGMDKISRGDMSVKVEMRGEADELMPALDRMTETMRSITADTQRMIEEAKKGNLDERCDTSGYSGSWAGLVNGINNLMDEISAPINELRGVLGKISVNDYTARMSGGYQGVFGHMAEETNVVRDRLLGVQDTIERISNGDTEKLEEIRLHGKRSDNDRLVPAIIKMMETINELIGEVKYLTEEGMRGNILQARGNADKFEGGFKETIRGFNSTLDAVSEPMRQLLLVLKAMSVNDFTSKVDRGMPGDYGRLMSAAGDVQDQLLGVQELAVSISAGDIGKLEEYRAAGKRSDNDRITPALTQMMASISSLIDETTQIAESAASGNLQIRGDESRFKGGYRQIIGAVNEFLEAVERPTNEIKRVLTDMAEARFSVSIQGNYQGDFKLLTDSANQLASSLNNMVDELSGTMSRIAQGDVDIERIRDYKGDFHSISQAMNTILDGLNELLSNIRVTADQVATGATQVSAGSQTLSDGATEQASTVEEFSATITQIAAQTRENAQNAVETDRLVAKVKGDAETGKSKMSSMLTSMDEINSASVNISKVIKVIDDLAFQTNILALNAAVEAARAGQYGKGFAVVAEEVRNLAARSATAAKETSELIETTIQKIKGGAAYAGETAEAFSGITQGVVKMSELVSRIATASSEQADGIAQIDSGVSVISNVVQTNSATAEESAASSEELSGQAEELRKQVAQFQLRQPASLLPEAY